MSADNSSAEDLASLSDQELFQRWVEVMDDSLEVFITMLPRDVGQALDYTPESLNVLERWILERYPRFEDIVAESEVLEVDGMARYVGETIRRHTGGTWSVDYRDSKNVYYALPTLEFDGRAMPVCPQTLVTASTDRRTGTYLSSVASYVISKAPASNDS